MDELHSDQVVDVMKRGLNKPTSPVLVILHDKLEHVRSEDLSLIVESAAGTQRPVVCLVTKKTNDPIGMKLLESFSAELSMLEKEATVEASFLFTEYDEYMKTKMGMIHN